MLLVIRGIHGDKVDGLLRGQLKNVNASVSGNPTRPRLADHNPGEVDVSPGACLTSTA